MLEKGIIKLDSSVIGNRNSKICTKLIFFVEFINIYRKNSNRTPWDSIFQSTKNPKKLKNIRKNIR